MYYSGDSDKIKIDVKLNKLTIIDKFNEKLK